MVVVIFDIGGTHGTCSATGKACSSKWTKIMRKVTWLTEFIVYRRSTSAGVLLIVSSVHILIPFLDPCVLCCNIYIVKLYPTPKMESFLWRGIYNMFMVFLWYTYHFTVYETYHNLNSKLWNKLHCIFVYYT